MSEPPLLPPDELSEGHAAGRSWALAELAVGREHPIPAAPPTGGRWRIFLDERASARIFDGLCAGRSRRYLRGFLAGVSETWHSLGTLTRR